MVKYIFGAIFFTIIFSFKPVTIYFTQIYTSLLLKQNVKITSFTLSPLKAEAYIDIRSNRVTADVESIIPLKVLATYSGSIDAFKTFHPLLGTGVATATITYDKKLVVKGEASLYGSKTKVIVEELPYDWYVSVDASSLDLRTFQKQNSQELGIDAKIDLKLTLITDANTSLDLSTKSLNVSGQVIKDINIKLFHKDDNFKINSSFKPPNFYKTTLKASGYHKGANITAYTTIDFKDENIIINDLNFNTENFHTTIHTSSLGGVLDATYKDDYLFFDAKNLHLSKVLKTAQQKIKARGYINLKGSLNTKNLNTSFSFSSAKITTKTQKIEAIKLNIPDLKYRDEKLSASYKLQSTLLNKVFSFKGDVAYKDKVKLSAITSDFGGESAFNLNGKKFNLSMKKLEIKELLKFATQKPLASGKLNLDANGDFKNINFNLSTDALIKDKNIRLNTDGSYDVELALLKSNFMVSVPLKNDSFELNGKLSFKDYLRLEAHSSSFESNTLFKLKNKHFKFYTHDINLKKVTNALDKPTYMFGHLDFEADGIFEDINFKVKSLHLQPSMLLSKIDNSVSLDINGNYKPDTLKLKNRVTLNYKKKLLPIDIDATVSLKTPYNSKGTFFSNSDKVIIDSFSYENKQVKSNFLVDIKELNRYRAITRNELHGPLLLDGKFTDTLNITTNSFGGLAQIKLNKTLASIELNELNATKLTYLLDKKALLKQGTLSGSANYNIEEKVGTSDLYLRDTIVLGINLDDTLSTLNDALSLNVINMSKSFISSFENKQNLNTYIKHLQFNTSLTDANVTLNDVAISTNKFRITALGSLKDNGDINSLDLSIVDKNGCAIITQGLSGNIKDPKTANTSTTIVNIVENIPSSILGTGKKILDFGTMTIDNVASLGVQNILRTDSEVSFTSDIISQSVNLLDVTSNVIMPRGCNIIYHGKVKHPVKEKNEKKF